MFDNSEIMTLPSLISNTSTNCFSPGFFCAVSTPDIYLIKLVSSNISVIANTDSYLFWLLNTCTVAKTVAVTNIRITNETINPKVFLFMLIKIIVLTSLKFMRRMD